MQQYLWSDQVKLWHRILECVNTKADIVHTVKHDFTMIPGENGAFQSSHTACCVQCPVCIHIDGCHIFRPRLYIATYSRIEIIDASHFSGWFDLPWVESWAMAAVEQWLQSFSSAAKHFVDPLLRGRLAFCRLAWLLRAMTRHGTMESGQQHIRLSLHLFISQKLNRRNMPPYAVLLSEIIGVHFCFLLVTAYFTENGTRSDWLFFACVW